MSFRFIVMEPLSRVPVELKYPDAGVTSLAGLNGAEYSSPSKEMVQVESAILTITGDEIVASAANVFQV